MLDVMKRTDNKKARKSGLSNDLLDVIGSYETDFWCPGKDSNLHASRHTDLNRARLPIPPPGQGGWRYVRGGRDHVNRARFLRPDAPVQCRGEPILDGGGAKARFRVNDRGRLFHGG
jgi:hypothetical protein